MASDFLRRCDLQLSNSLEIIEKIAVEIAFGYGNL